ncbi:MAG TPA: hypothetical protein VGC30_15705 [Dokdonella sp.]
MSHDTPGVEAAFWATLLQHLLEQGEYVPKYQLERAIGPILGLFVEDFLSAVLLGHDVVVLAAEFPLKNRAENVYRSTNVDWLAYDRIACELILLELKTDPASVRDEQLGIYREVAAEEKPWRRLREQFCEIAQRSRSPKYRSAAKKLEERARRCTGIECASAHIVYLAPESSRALLTGAGVRFFSFSDVRARLRSTAGLRSDAYRDALCESLCRLDEVADESAPDRGRERNYRARAGLDEIVRRCEDGEPIMVGFVGGADALRKLDASELESRTYKWDWRDPHVATGRKDARNWISADQFLGTVRSVRSRRTRSADDLEPLLSALRGALGARPDLRLGRIIADAIPDVDATLDLVEGAEFAAAPAPRR